MGTIALVMIVKDEERCLKRCLDSVRGLVDRMIVVDTGSQDGTREIACRAGAEVYGYTWKNDFAEARNYALSLSDADWNLILDADEYITEGTRGDMDMFLRAGDCLGDVYIYNRYQEDGEESCVRFCASRILPRGVYFKGKIHEQPDTDLPSVLVPLKVEHDGYMQTGVKEKRNLPYLLAELEERPGDPYLLYKIAGSYQTLGDEERALGFFRIFYKEVSPQEAYRAKGVVGFLYSLMECGQFEEALKIVERAAERLDGYASYHFFCGVFYMKLILTDTVRYIGYLPEIEESYLRCLKIGAEVRDEEDIGAGSYKAAYNLGTWYEVSGDAQKAEMYYRQAAEVGYRKAQERLDAVLEAECTVDSIQKI